MMNQWMSEHDQQLTTGRFNQYGYLRFRGAERDLPFQFPPKFVNDGRKYEWEESKAYAFEPIQSFKGNGAREITLKWQYVVEVDEEYDVDSSYWSVGKIKSAINLLRSYHSFVKSQSNNNVLDIGSTKALVIDMRIYGIAGPNASGGFKDWTTLLKNVAITYSDNYVGPPQYAFPLVTTITADFRLWTNTDFDDKGVATALVSVNGLRPSPKPDDFWY